MNFFLSERKKNVRINVIIWGRRSGTHCLAVLHRSSGAHFLRTIGLHHIFIFYKLSQLHFALYISHLRLSYLRVSPGLSDGCYSFKTCYPSIQLFSCSSIFYAACRLRIVGEAEINAGWLLEENYILGRSTIYCKTITETDGHLHSRLQLRAIYSSQLTKSTCLWTVDGNWNARRKLERQEETYTECIYPQLMLVMKTLCLHSPSPDLLHCHSNNYCLCCLYCL